MYNYIILIYITTYILTNMKINQACNYSNFNDNYRNYVCPKVSLSYTLYFKRIYLDSKYK